MADYTVVPKPTAIPAAQGKRIDEIFGRVSSDSSDISVAHMVAPPGWSEPAQRPAFAELTILVRGRLRVEVAEGVVELSAGQAIRIEPGVRVRYANPYGDESEYWAICLPAFSLDAAHRED